ncbi:MAG: hypothetical protein P8Y99_00110 [Calditrichaceae bacterium]
MEKLIEKIYTLAESINPLRIYGQNDSHLKFIENELEVRLIARGHKVKIIGSEIQVNRTQEVLDEICQIFTKKDNLTNTDIETALKIYVFWNHLRKMMSFLQLVLLEREKPIWPWL